jgi:hypothetical protein
MRRGRCTLQSLVARPANDQLFLIDRAEPCDQPPESDVVQPWRYRAGFCDRGVAGVRPVRFRLDVHHCVASLIRVRRAWAAVEARTEARLG